MPPKRAGRAPHPVLSTGDQSGARKLLDTRMDSRPYVGRIPGDERLYLAPGESALAAAPDRFVET
ncbi:hypothetical protein [Actinoplanes sp. NPDC049802]|uniref:hypothetical protein n=1 Tax=Actinoplanes sp. NPDC049802 TaxID=3154742 RepID=UPI0033CD6F50